LPGFDIERARRAHSATSWTPEKRAEQERDAYTAHLAAVRAQLAPIAETEEQRAELDRLMTDYAAAYLAKTYAVLDARARTMNPMVTGPARFPTARNRKRMETELRRDEEREAWSIRAQARMRRTIEAMRTPEQIETDAYNDLARHLARTLAALEKIDANDPQLHGIDRAGIAANAAERLKRAAARGDRAAVRRALADAAAWQERTGRRVWAARAAVWRCAEEPERPAGAEEPAAPRSGPETIHDDGNGTTIERDPEADRVRIRFPGKPEPEVLARLKATGWRWSRSEGAWQRKDTMAARHVARQIVGAAGGPEAGGPGGGSASQRSAGVSGETSIQGAQGYPAEDDLALAEGIMPYLQANTADPFGVRIGLSDDRRGIRIEFPHELRPSARAWLERHGFHLSEERSHRQWERPGIAYADRKTAVDAIHTVCIFDVPMCQCGTSSHYGDRFCGECGERLS